MHDFGKALSLNKERTLICDQDTCLAVDDNTVIVKEDNA